MRRNLLGIGAPIAGSTVVSALYFGLRQGWADVGGLIEAAAIVALMTGLTALIAVGEVVWWRRLVVAVLYPQV